MYQDLLEMERKLDWTVTRKRVEVQDALSRTPTVRAISDARMRTNVDLADDADFADIPKPYCF